MAGVSLRFAVCLLSSAPVLSLSSCPTLWNPLDYSPPGSSIHGVFQARILEQVAISKQVAFLEPTWVRLEFSSFHSPSVSIILLVQLPWNNCPLIRAPKMGGRAGLWTLRVLGCESPLKWPQTSQDKIQEEVKDSWVWLASSLVVPDPVVQGYPIAGSHRPFVSKGPGSICCSVFVFPVV